MNIAKYNISRQESEKLLSDINLLKSSMNKKGEFSRSFIEISRSDELKPIYMTAIKNFDYDILLKDESIFQFSYDKKDRGLDLRYAFYQSPFLLKNDKDQETLLEQERTEVNIIDEEYPTEQELIEADINKHSVAIRYEFSKREYARQIHPASHFHIGIKNEIRIPVDKILSPLVFVSFVIKNVYISSWKNIVNETKYRDIFNKKNLCTIVESDFFQEQDKFELFLT